MHKHKKHHHKCHKCKRDERQEETKGLQKEEKNETVNDEILMECKSDLVKFKIKDGFIPVRMPVIITEVTVNINIENVVDLDKPILHINKVSGKVKLENCKLIPETNMLFLSGTVIKSIEYCEQSSGGSKINGQMKNIIVNVPFKCVTRVKYIVKPIYYGGNKCLKIININNEKTFIDTYSEEEKICCELINVKFEELNEKDQDNSKGKVPNSGAFKRLRQRMVMHITVRLIQNQTIFVFKEGVK